MKFRRKLCPRCPKGVMRIRHSSRGYYYHCVECTHTIPQGVVDNLRVEDEDNAIVSIHINTATQGNVAAC